jgi:hypothetical protein
MIFSDGLTRETQESSDGSVRFNCVYAPRSDSVNYLLPPFILLLLVPLHHFGQLESNPVFVLGVAGLASLPIWHAFLSKPASWGSELSIPNMTLQWWDSEGGQDDKPGMPVNCACLKAVRYIAQEFQDDETLSTRYRLHMEDGRNYIIAPRCIPEPFAIYFSRIRREQPSITLKDLTNPSADIDIEVWGMAGVPVFIDPVQREETVLLHNPTGYGLVGLVTSLAILAVIAAVATSGDTTGVPGGIKLLGNLFPTPLIVLLVAYVCFLGWWIWRYLVRGFDEGSRVELGARKLVWWHGPSPRREQIIDLDAVARAANAHVSGDKLELVTRTGALITVPGGCIGDVENWVRRIPSYFPHIKI